MVALGCRELETEYRVETFLQVPLDSVRISRLNEPVGFFVGFMYNKRLHRDVILMVLSLLH